MGTLLIESACFLHWTRVNEKKETIHCKSCWLWFGFVRLRTQRRALRTLMGSGNNRAEWPPSYSPAAAKNTTPNSTQSVAIPGPGVVASEDIGIGGWRRDGMTIQGCMQGWIFVGRRGEYWICRDALKAKVIATGVICPAPMLTDSQNTMTRLE